MGEEKGKREGVFGFFSPLVSLLVFGVLELRLLWGTFNGRLLFKQFERVGMVYVILLFFFLNWSY